MAETQALVNPGGMHLSMFFNDSLLAAAAAAAAATLHHTSAVWLCEVAGSCHDSILILHFAQWFVCCNQPWPLWRCTLAVSGSI
jgi:hypothetical protein